MELETEIEAVRTTFNAFNQSVKAGDFSSYLNLYDPEVAAGVSEDLFARNSDRAKAHAFEFDLDRIQFDGRFATVSFTVKPGDGATEHEDQSEITLVRNDEHWMLYET